MKLSDQDRGILQNAYNSFLKHLAQYLQDNAIVELNQVCSTFTQLLKSGKFCSSDCISFDSDYRDLFSGSGLSLGLMVMSGIYCCRHANTLLHDFLIELGYSSQILYSYIDDGSIKITSPREANHLLVQVQEGEEKLIVDAYNEFSIKHDHKSTSKKLVSDTSTLKPFVGYCEHDTNQISEIVGKYYHLRSLGVSYVYDHR